MQHLQLKHPFSLFSASSPGKTGLVVSPTLWTRLLMFSLKSGGRSARLRAEEDSGPNKLGRSVPAPATMRRFNASISDRRLWESLDSRVSLMVSCFVFFLVDNFYSNNLSNMKRVENYSLQHSKMTLKYYTSIKFNTFRTSTKPRNLHGDTSLDSNQDQPRFCFDWFQASWQRSRFKTRFTRLWLQVVKPPVDFVVQGLNPRWFHQWSNGGKASQSVEVSNNASRKYWMISLASKVMYIE